MVTPKEELLVERGSERESERELLSVVAALILNGGTAALACEASCEAFLDWLRVTTIRN